MNIIVKEEKLLPFLENIFEITMFGNPEIKICPNEMLKKELRTRILAVFCLLPLNNLHWLKLSIKKVEIFNIDLNFLRKLLKLFPDCLDL